MIIFLYGKNTFLSLQKLKDLKEEYRKKNKTGINMREIDLRKDGFSTLRDEFRSKSMFSEKKLFILRNAFSNPSFKKNFLDSKEKFLKSKNVLIFFERGVPLKKDPFLSFLKKEAKTQEFPLLKGKKVEDWIKKEGKRLNLKISSSNAKLLASRKENDLWALAAFLQKMAAWKGDEKTVKREDILSLTSPGIEKDIFKTIDAIAKKKRGEALRLLFSHLEKGDSPFYLLSMIAWQTTRLLAVKEKLEKGEDPQTLNWHPYVIKKSVWISQNFDSATLEKIHDRILDLDVKSKTGRISPEGALELLVAAF